MLCLVYARLVVLLRDGLAFSEPTGVGVAFG